MSINRHIVVAAAFALLGSFGAAHAQDLKPLQADVDNLKQQVSRLQADLSAANNPPKPQAPPPKLTAPVGKGAVATGTVKFGALALKPR